jgi:uridine kinase
MTEPHLVTVSGIDGSGKSELGRRLAGACAGAGTPTVLLRVDDFRRTIDFAKAGRPEVDVYYDDYFDLAALGAAVDAARAAAGDGLVLVEGIFVRRVPALDGAFSIWLEVPRAEAARRIEARDVPRGRSLEDVRHRIAARYFPAQDRYLRAHDPVSAADLLIDNGDFRHPRVLRGGDPTTWPAPLRRPLATMLALPPPGPTP